MSSRTSLGRSPWPVHRDKGSRSLFQHAEGLIPGGIHLSGRSLLGADSAPLYFERGAGSHIWDVDGNEYIDFIMAYGPFLLGYAHSGVDKAAFFQASQGNLLSLNHPLHQHFIEAVLYRFPSAEMGLFFKTGSEATTAAVRIARRATGRRKIARCGYHGWHDWCLPDEDSVPDGLHQQVLQFDALRPETLTTLIDAGNHFAAVIVAPEMIYPPNAGCLTRLIDVARSDNSVFIMDEVKTGFRAPENSMQAFYGLTPDLTTLSKALGNGWPVAAVVGSRAVMGHAAGMHLSATYHGDTAPMAAAIATMDVIDQENVQRHVWALGERLIEGINRAAALRQFPVEAIGEPIPPMPFVRFTHPDAGKNDIIKRCVYSYAMSKGILLHPRHMWFLSASHTMEEIDRTIAILDEAMHYISSNSIFEDTVR